jgi:hypothetical protein
MGYATKKMVILGVVYGGLPHSSYFDRIYGWEYSIHGYDPFLGWDSTIYFMGTSLEI